MTVGSGNDGEEREQVVNGYFPYNRLLVTLQSTTL